MSDLSTPHSYLHDHCTVAEQPPRSSRFRWLKTLAARCMAHFTSGQNAFNSNVVRTFDMLHHRPDVLDERIDTVAREAIAAHEATRQVATAIANHDLALSNLTSAINGTRDVQEHHSTVIGGVQEAAARLSGSVESVSARQDDLLRGLEQASDRVARAEQGFVELRALMNRLGSSLGLLKSAVDEAAVLPARHGKAAAESPAAHVAHAVDEAAYQAFEDSQRGSEAEVKARLAVYVDRVRGLHATRSRRVLDVGCGRGEFLDLLKAAHIPAYGVDCNDAAVARSRAKGLDVHQADLLDEVRAAKRGSLAAVAAFHVIEHLQHNQLAEFIALAATRLDADGLLILETPSALNLTVAASDFYKDPTHVRPVHPALLSHMLVTAGFVAVEVSFLNPFPADQRLVLSHTGLAEVLKGNLERIDNALFGCRDCAVIGRRGGGTP